MSVLTVKGLPSLEDLSGGVLEVGRRRGWKRAARASCALLGRSGEGSLSADTGEDGGSSDEDPDHSECLSERNVVMVLGLD